MELPFKTAVITDEISQDFAVAAGLAREFGLDGLELRSAWGKGPHELSDAEIACVRDIAGEASLAVCGIAPPLLKCELGDEAAFAQHMEILRRSAKAAHALGTSQVRGFAFWRRGPLEEVKDAVVRHLKEAARIADGEGVTIALENEYSTANNNVAHTLELIEAVGSPRLKLLFDPGNDIYDTEGERPWPDAYEMARSTMAHMHLKDPGRDPRTGEIRALPIGEGDTHIEDLMAALLRDGYTGYVSLETHYRRAALQHEIQRLPAGEDFSAGGYVASRECLEKWFAILSRLTGTPAA